MDPSPKTVRGPFGPHKKGNQQMKTATEVTKYLADGVAVHVHQIVEGGFIVQSIYQDEETEYMDGPKYLVERVFDSAPTVALDERITALREEVETLSEKRNAIRAELREIEVGEKARLARIRTHKGLERLDLFIQGKITHFADLTHWHPGIFEFKYKENQSEYDRDAMKLLSLFGRTNGDLEWRLNQYSDGSGSSSIVVPCTSYEEAQEHLQKLVDSEVKIGRNLSRWVETAKKYNLKISQEVVEQERRDRLEVLEKNRLEYLAKAEEFRAQHEALMAAPSHL